MKLNYLLLLALPYVNSFALPASSLQHTNSKPAPFLGCIEKGGASARKGRFTFRNSASSATEPLEGDDQEIKEVKSKLTKEFFTIAFPAFIQLAAEPLASLVDTAYLGRLGPEVLGGAGVAISAQYAVSKLYNDPLLRTSISLVASQDGKARGNQDGEGSEEEAKKDLSIAVSSALLLAASVGIIQLVIYASLASGIIKGMG